MKQTFFIFLSFLSLTVTAQKALIKGKITTPDGKTAEFVSINLKGTNKSTLSNEQGKYEINNIELGEYTIVVKSIGHEIISKNISIQTPQELIIDFQLQESETSLNEVIVSAGRKKESIDEVPSSVSIVGLKAIEQNLGFTSNLGDILDNRVPGLAPSNNLSSSWGQTLRGRGMLIMVDGVPQSTPLRNGAMDLRALDPAVIERVEVIKGASAIYGNGAAGGLINYITRTSKTNQKISGATSVASTGSLTSLKSSMGGRISQLLMGRIDKFDYVLSGVIERTGEFKDAQGDVLPPVYGLGETDSYNGFIKLGYKFFENHAVSLKYNYYSSQQHTDYVTVNGDYSKGIKTTAKLGTTVGAPQGVKGNQNIDLQFVGLTNFKKTSYDIDLYYQNVDNVFFQSAAFVDGGQSRILSKKKGARFLFHTPLFSQENIDGELSYGVDFQNDITSQPLVDGRIWVPEMNMWNVAPYAQTKFKVFNNLILKGGLRFEKVNIAVENYATLPTVNTTTGAVTPSIDVMGGDLKYDALMVNAGLRYNAFPLFEPFVSFSQGFSVADVGLALRAARVNDIEKINTKAIINNHYEAGFSSQIKKVNFEAVGYYSTSDLGVNTVYINGLYETVRAPERIWGYEFIVDASVTKNLKLGASYAFVEGKIDNDANGSFDDDVDAYLGGQRISAPKISGNIDWQIIPSKWNLLMQYTHVLKRDRFAQNAKGSYDAYKGPISPYKVINLSTSFAVTKAISLNLGIENLLNEDYFVARSQWGTWNDSYFKGKGSSYRLTFNYKF